MKLSVFFLLIMISCLKTPHNPLRNELSSYVKGDAKLRERAVSYGDTVHLQITLSNITNHQLVINDYQTIFIRKLPRNFHSEHLFIEKIVDKLSLDTIPALSEKIIMRKIIVDDSFFSRNDNDFELIYVSDCNNVTLNKDLRYCGALLVDTLHLRVK